jgi:hypothetical protein
VEIITRYIEGIVLGIIGRYDLLGYRIVLFIILLDDSNLDYRYSIRRYEEIFIRNMDCR